MTAPAAPAKDASPVPKKVPPFRIEVRTGEDSPAWWIIEFAHTEEQRDSMLKRRALEYGEKNSRGVANGSLSDAEWLLRYVAASVVAPLVAALEFIVAEDLVKKFHADKAVDISELKSPEVIAADLQQLLEGELPPGFPPPPPVVSVPIAIAEQATGAQPAGAIPIDAVVGETPLPFGVGDEVKDQFTEKVIRVTAVHRADGTGRAFDWIDEDKDATEKTGTCPINSVGCFVKVESKRKKRRED